MADGLDFNPLLTCGCIRGNQKPFNTHSLNIVGLNSISLNQHMCAYVNGSRTVSIGVHFCHMALLDAFPVYAPLVAAVKNIRYPSSLARSIRIARRDVYFTVYRKYSLNLCIIYNFFQLIIRIHVINFNLQEKVSINYEMSM